MAGARKSGTPSSLAPFLIPLGLAGGLAATWFQLPGVLVLWLVLVVVAFTEPPVELTGKKDSYGYPTPANPNESNRLDSFRAIRSLRTRLLLPGGHWMPGWPVQASWLLGLCLAALALALPISAPEAISGGSTVSVTEDGTVQQVPQNPAALLLEVFAPLLQALAAFVITTSAAAALRDRAGDDHPGSRIDALSRVLSAKPVTFGAFALAGIAGVVVVVVAVFVTLPDLGSNLTGAAPWVWPVLLVVAAGLALTPMWREEALKGWHVLTGARRLWESRWPAVKMADPMAVLTQRESVGSATIDHFDAPGSVGSGGYLPLAPKLAPVVGAGHTVIILGSPQLDGDGAPVPGTIDPVRFRVVDLDDNEPVDLADPALSSEVVATMIEAGTAQATDALGLGRVALLDVAALHEDGASRAAYEVTFAGMPWPTLRTMVGALPGFFMCEALVDHKGQRMFVGELSDPSILADPTLAGVFDDLRQQDFWNTVWGSASLERHKASQPTVYAADCSQARLAGGGIVNRTTFVTRQGVPPGDYFGTEPKLAASLSGAPFVAVTGYHYSGSRRGERHTQGLCVYHSKSAVPLTPDTLAPSAEALVEQVDEQAGARPRRGPRRASPAAASTADQATHWVLAGMMNKALEQVKLARPEVVEARALTTTASRGHHLWRVTLRLHGGVTVSDVRTKQDRLREALGVPWLRVAGAEDGVVLYVGADPAKARLVNPVTDQATLVSLDWERHFSDAGVIGVNSSLPTLVEVSHLPKNEKVQVLDFTLPAGVDVNFVKSAVRKLRSSTGNLFVELRSSSHGPSHFTLYVCPENPVPFPARFEWDTAAQADEEHLMFATNVEGEPVYVDLLDGAHALVAGTSGSGKAQPLDHALPVPPCAAFPQGRATIGDITPGTVIYGGDRQPTTVISLSPVVERSVHWVQVADGRSVSASADHLWQVLDRCAARLVEPDVDRAARLRDLASTYGPTSYASVLRLGEIADVSQRVIEEVTCPDMTVDTSATRFYPVAETLLLAAYAYEDGQGLRCVRSTRDLIALGTHDDAGQPRFAFVNPDADGQVLPITSVSMSTEVVPMRCLVVDHPEHTYLTGEDIPTHNSVLAQNLLWSAAAKGMQVVVCDAQKEAADFEFVREHATLFATDLESVAATMQAVYAEGRRRIGLNTRYKVGHSKDLPEEVRPPRLVVFVDEFTSLLEKEAVPAKSDDIEDEKAREEILRINGHKNKIGQFSGKIARELRSARISLFLGTQKLMAKTLDTIPGGGDLKDQLARILLGNPATPVVMSTLRNFENMPDLGEAIPKGRGVYESLSSSAPITIQTWFAPQGAETATPPPGSLAGEIAARVPVIDHPALDISPYLPKPVEETTEEFGPPPGFGEDLDADGIEVELDEVVDLGELELGDIDLGDLEVLVDEPLREVDEPADAPVEPEAPATPEAVEPDEPATTREDEDSEPEPTGEPAAWTEPEPAIDAWDDLSAYAAQDEGGGPPDTEPAEEPGEDTDLEPEEPEQAADAPEAEPLEEPEPEPERAVPVAVDGPTSAGPGELVDQRGEPGEVPGDRSGPDAGVDRDDPGPGGGDPGGGVGERGDDPGRGDSLDVDSDDPTGPVRVPVSGQADVQDPWGFDDFDTPDAPASPDRSALSVDDF